MGPLRLPSDLSLSLASERDVMAIKAATEEGVDDGS